MRLFTVSLAGSLFFSVSADAARPRILLYLLLTLAPFAVLGPFIAPVIDRGPGGYRFVILATSLGRCLACLAMTVSLDSLLFFPEAFAVLVLGRTYSVAKSSIVARLIGRRRAPRVGQRAAGPDGHDRRRDRRRHSVRRCSRLLHPPLRSAPPRWRHTLALVVGWRLPHRSPPHEKDQVLDKAEIHQTRLTSRPPPWRCCAAPSGSPRS